MPEEMNDRAMTILVHGLSKSGKSTLAVTAPAPRLLMDVESASRFLPIKRIRWDPSKEAPPEYDGTWDTAVVATRDWDTVNKAYQWLASQQHPFKSFIIDSISELQQRYVDETTGRLQATQQQWGDIFRATAGLVRDIRDLTLVPKSPLEAIVVTSMTKHIDGMWRPWVQGQLLTVLPYIWDAVGYLSVEQVADEFTGNLSEVRRLLTRRTFDIEAGERLGGRVPMVLDNPNISEMLDMVFGPVIPPGEIKPMPTTKEEENTP